MQTIEEYMLNIKAKMELTHRKAFVAELFIGLATNGKWHGYIWIFDGINGKRYMQVGEMGSILDCLAAMERRINVGDR